MKEVFLCIDTRVIRSSNQARIMNQQEQEIEEISSCVCLDFVKQIFEKKKISLTFSYFGRTKKKKKTKLTRTEREK
jgi:hypothetical protein